MRRLAWRHLRSLVRRVVIRDELWWVAGVTLVLVIGVFLSWLYWEDLRGDQESLSTTIRNLGLVIGGVIAILLAVWRSRVAERQADTSQQSLLNARYERGAEMLGNDVLSVRLGGIYALQRLAWEHPDQYHIQIMHLFCSFARNPPGSAKRIVYQYAENELTRRLREDVQAVMNAIGARSKTGLGLEKAAEDFQLDLRDADLHGASLRRANLAGAVLIRAELGRTDLQEADLSRSNLGFANLDLAMLAGAKLSGADLLGTNLSRTFIQHTDFSFAGFQGANLIWRILRARHTCDPFGA